MRLSHATQQAAARSDDRRVADVHRIERQTRGAGELDDLGASFANDVDQRLELLNRSGEVRRVGEVQGAPL